METLEIVKALEQYKNDPEVDGFNVSLDAIIDLIEDSHPFVKDREQAIRIFMSNPYIPRTIFGKSLTISLNLENNQFQICKTYPYPREAQ